MDGPDEGDDLTFDGEDVNGGWGGGWGGGGGGRAGDAGPFPKAFRAACMAKDGVGASWGKELLPGGGGGMNRLGGVRGAGTGGGGGALGGDGAIEEERGRIRDGRAAGSGVRDSGNSVGGGAGGRIGTAESD